MDIRQAKVAALAVVLASVSFVQLHAQVSVRTRATSLGTAIKKLQQKTGYKFFYADEISSTRVKAVTARNESMAEVLSRMFAGTGVTYTIADKTVYLKYNPQSVHERQSQEPRKQRLTGIVIDEQGEPLIGATVTVKGTSEHTVTDIDGRYQLATESKSPTLLFSYLGFAQKEIAAKGKSVVNASLTPDQHALDEVVVTALGIKREKKLLGYAVQDVHDDILNLTGDHFITSALEGKVAGMQVNVSNNGLGSSAKITIRGNSSFTDNNQPLWIVDGVPFTDDQSSGASAYGGYDRGGTALDINPEDIESISVLKGPNAAALYGSRAGNGVILVTTKRGKHRKGLGVRYNGVCTWSRVSTSLPMQHEYGQGSRGQTEYTTDDDGNRLSLADKLSFGAKLDGHGEPSWLGEIIPYKYYGDKQREYFRTGFTQSHTVALGNNGNTSHFRASFGYNSNDGIFSDERLGKYNIDLNAGTSVNEKMTIDGKISLSRTKAENRPFTGYNSEMAQLLLIPGNVRLDDLKHYSSDARPHQNWFGPDQQYSNPYYVRHRYRNSDERWRAFGYFSLNYTLLRWLKMNVRYAVDYYRTRIQDTDLSLASQAITNGSKTWQSMVSEDKMTRSEDNHFEHNIQLMFSGENGVVPQLRLGYNVGANVMYQNYEYLTVGVENMLDKDNWLFDTGYRLSTGDNNGHERSMYSLFGSAQLSFAEWAFLELTARNDWSSTLPTKNNSFFYPSANLSFVFSDFMRWAGGSVPHWLTFGKLRVSAAQVGKDPDPYNLYNTRQFQFVGGIRQPVVSTIKKNSNLKPELKTSYEAGLDMKFLDNRIGFDLTYYHSETRNQAMLVDTSAPWTQQWVNAGCISNTGYELTLYAKPVKTPDFNFDLTLNMAHNRSVVRRLADGVKRLYFTGDENMPVKVGAVAGGKLGDIYANNLMQRDSKGRVVVGSDGLPQPVAGDGNLESYILSHPIGNIQPDMLMSLSPSFSYRGLTLTMLFDMKFGGDIVSVSEGMATSVGTSARTAQRGEYKVVNGEKDFYMVVPGVREDGSVNDIPVSAEAYYSAVGLYKSQKGYAEEFVYDASFIKLKEIALGYSLPQSVLRHTPLSTLRLSLVARNICFLMKHAPGNPDGGYDTTMFSQALDFAATPYTRTFGFAVSASF